MVLEILDSCKEVICNSKDVKINASKIPDLAVKIYEKIEKGILTPDEFKKSPLHPKSDDEVAINWIFVIDSLNYCFFDPNSKRHWTVTWKNETHTGYFGLCAAINKAIDNGINMTDMRTCLELSREQLDEILLGDDGSTLPLLQERYQCLQQSADILLKKYKGSFLNCIIEANNSAQKLLLLISENFSYFRDESFYNNKKVFIYKRAQILIADIWSSFAGCGYGEFHDIDSLTMFADYRVPQVLLYFGVLEYSDNLVENLKKGILLDHGSLQEVEIRAASIVAVDQVVFTVKELLSKNNVKKKCNAVMVDTYLWGYRRENAITLEDTPYHKTLNIFY
ncbi:queuosine salvage protein isoform X2 [Adelges cooleyi]|nr:queuosine salvage protein isoform X2 [Adelges cooleyi]XP_050428478.1 queuosine salvage protein isoform X2 [Adelges cooleyi]XP_050428480.1 queuosine salvage protein isoform X2 [Adelges cooleyi]